MSREEEQLRVGLRGYAEQMAATQTPPPAAGIWLRAERRRRRMAVEQAERPLRVMQGLGLLCAALAAAWVLVRSGSFDHPMPTVGTAMVVLAVGAASLVAGGCWAMVRASR